MVPSSNASGTLELDGFNQNSFSDSKTYVLPRSTLLTRCCIRGSFSHSVFGKSAKVGSTIDNSLAALCKAELAVVQIDINSINFLSC